MSYLRPATIEVELNQKIDNLTVSLSEFLDVESWDIRKLIIDAKKLIKVDPAEGHSVLAKIYHLCGNVDLMRYHLENAYRLNRDMDFIGVRCACESNLGFSSEAQKFFAIVADPVNGCLSRCIDIAFSCGSFLLLGDYINQAEKMGMDLSPDDVKKTRDICTIFSNAGITDDYVASVLDIAGTVMRERNNVSRGFGSTTVSLRNGCVIYNLALSLPGEVVAEIGEEFADRLARSPLPLFDELLVSFRPI